MLNLMWYQIKAAREKPNRLYIYLYVAPGLAKTVHKLLLDRGFWSLVHSSNTLVFKEPATVVAFLRALDPSMALTAALDRYEAATGPDQQGWGRSRGPRDPALLADQVAAAGQLLALLTE